MNGGKKMIRMCKQNKEKIHETFCKKRAEEYIICSGLRLQQLLMLNHIFRRSLKYIYLLIRDMKYTNLPAKSFFDTKTSF